MIGKTKVQKFEMEVLRHRMKYTIDHSTYCFSSKFEIGATLDHMENGEHYFGHDFRAYRCE